MGQSIGRTLWAAACLAAVAAACGEPRCPRGYDKRGDICYRIKDAGGDASESIPGGGEPSGSGDREPGDPGGDSVGEPEEDGSAGVRGEDARGVPQIQGAASMAPGRELWTWTVPEGTTHFELLLDDVTPADAERRTEARFSAPLEAGDHTLKVRACRVSGSCSGWAVHTTRVESYGSDLPRGLRDAARALSSTALGHRVAIGCNDCADGPSSEVYGLEQAAASMERAIARGADLLELNIASIGGALYASPADTSSVGARPLLADLLRREKIADADALVALEVVEEAGASEPASGDFAEALFSILDAVPSLARNGRPLWLRSSYANRRHLQALADESDRHPVTGPYVRFILSDPGSEPSTFYGPSDHALIPSLDFLDAVSVDFRLSNLPYRLERIRAAGSAVIIENVPGPGHGEIVIGALREQADAFISDYRVDQATKIVTQPDTGAFFSARDIAADGRVLTIHGVRRGASVFWEQELDWTFQDTLTSGITLSTPVAVSSVGIREFFGAHLSFEQDIRSLHVADPKWALEPSPGFLFSFAGTLPTLEPSTVSPMFGCWPSRPDVGLPNPGIWSAGLRTENGELIAAFATPEPGQDEPRNRARVALAAAGENRGCMSRNQSFTEKLTEGDVRWLVLSYDGLALRLFVDGKCAGEAWVIGADGQDDVAATTAIGSGVFGAYYSGRMQQLSVLRWTPVRSDGEN